jgi:hypothetical protein
MLGQLDECCLTLIRVALFINANCREGKNEKICERQAKLSEASELQ